MRIEEITVETVAIEPPHRHPDASSYETVVFRVLPPDHPNSFTVPVSVNLSQVGAQDAQRQARFIFHRLMRALAEASAPWDRGTPADGAEQAVKSAEVPSSPSEGRLGPAADPAEGKR